MGILLDENTRLLIQGMGAAGAREARICLDYGTSVVAGVTPGRGGQEIEGVPVRNTVAEAVAEFDANVSMIFVPAPFAAEAIIESVGAGMPVVVCITEGIPTLDMVLVKRYLRGSGTVLIGPNCPGVITPGAATKWVPTRTKFFKKALENECLVRSQGELLEAPNWTMKTRKAFPCSAALVPFFAGAFSCSVALVF